MRERGREKMQDSIERQSHRRERVKKKEDGMRHRKKRKEKGALVES